MATKGERWMQQVSERSKKRGRVGALHRALGIPMGQNIPASMLKSAAKKQGRIGEMARLALVYKKARK